MRTKSLILLIIAIGCGVIASVAVSQVMLDQKEGEPTRTIGVLVTAKDVSPMTKIAAELIRTEQWPIDRVPVGALTDIKEIEGKYAKQRLYTGEPIIEAKLSSRGKDLVVPAGYRIFDLKVDDSNGGSGYIGPGDRVDVTGFFEKGTRFPKSKSVRVMRNMEVAMVDGVSFRDPEAALKKATTIQLLVQDRQYEALDTACNLGKLKLSLRAPDTESETNSPDAIDDADTFLKWLKENETKKDRIASSAGGVDSMSMIKGMFDALKPTATVEAQREMMVLTPGSVSVYRWVQGRKMPVLITPEEYYASTRNPLSSPVDSDYRFLPEAGVSPSTVAIPPVATPLNGETPGIATPGANAGQSNMVWDPQSGTWQSSGFKPVYPQSQ